MTDLTKMWRELERYQPYADKRGFGDAWRKMCEHRAGKAPWSAPWIAVSAARSAGRAAAWAARDAAWAAGWAADDAAYAQVAVERIRKAIEQEQT